MALDVRHNPWLEPILMSFCPSVILSFQCANAMDMLDVAASIWSCTSCRVVCPAAFAITVNMIRPDGIVTIAGRDIIGMPPSHPIIVKSANVSEIPTECNPQCCPPGRCQGTGQSSISDLVNCQLDRCL